MERARRSRPRNAPSVTEKVKSKVCFVRKKLKPFKWNRLIKKKSIIELGPWQSVRLTYTQIYEKLACFESLKFENWEIAKTLLKTTY